MRSSSARCLASNGEGGSGTSVDDLLPNSAENGNKLGVWRVWVAGLSFAALSLAALSLAGFSLAGLAAVAAGGAALPVFGSGAGIGSGIFSLTAGSAAEAEGAPRVARAVAATIAQHKPITPRQRIGATAIRPDPASRLGAIFPLPPMRCIRTPRLRPPETIFAKCALWQIRD